MKKTALLFLAVFSFLAIFQSLTPPEKTADNADTSPGSVNAENEVRSATGRKRTQSERPQDQDEVSSEDAPFIQKVLSETWLDTFQPSRDRGRRRIRIAKTTFKYPYLRFEERVFLDEKTGQEQVERLRTSVADHLIVGAHQDIDLKSLESELRSRGFQLRPSALNSSLLVQLSDFENSKSHSQHLEDLLELEGLIKYAEPDWLVLPCATPNDPAFTDGKLWHLENDGQTEGFFHDLDIDAVAGWDFARNATGIVVAVADSGIRYTHEDLAPNMWHGLPRHGIDAYDDDDDPMDTEGHGTHCAGIIGARGNNGIGTTGVAWQVELMALRFLGPNGGTTSDAIRVIDFARTNGANIINASWASDEFSQALYDAIETCNEAGIPFVTAAGNIGSNNDETPRYPASFDLPNVISVAATNEISMLALFSNRGRQSVDTAAPGVKIWSCGIESDSDYRSLSGTSAAASQVTGGLALAKFFFPEKSTASLLDDLLDARVPNSDLQFKIKSGGGFNLAHLLSGETPPPQLDDFSTPYWITGGRLLKTVYNENLTRASDEDSYSPGTGQRSAWFRWTAPAAGSVDLRAKGSRADISLVAFEGQAKNSLQRIGDNFTERPTGTSLVQFEVEAGKTYSLSVDSRYSTQQTYEIDFSFSPSNDQFAEAAIIDTGGPFQVVGNNAGATVESFEPFRRRRRTEGKSIWYRWTAANDGEIILTAQPSDIDALLEVYIGSDPNNLTLVVSNDARNSNNWKNEVTFAAVAGTTYHVLLDTYQSSSNSGRAHTTLTALRPDILFIFDHPESQEVRLGEPARLEVSAGGDDPRYQWELNGEIIPGAVLPFYDLSEVKSENLGTYRVRVYQDNLTRYSEEALLTETPTIPRVLWLSPNASFATGSTHELQVSATGTTPLNFQWYKDGVTMPGENSHHLALREISEDDQASYTVAIQNSRGSIISEPIEIDVQARFQDDFRYLDETSESYRVEKIVKKDGLWVAASYAFNAIRISTSGDGENWNHQLLREQNPKASMGGELFLEYGNGFWLCGRKASQSQGVDLISFKSSDLQNWELHYSKAESLGTDLQSCFFKGFFYLRGNFGVYRSSDGETWFYQTTPDGAGFRSDFSGRIADNEEAIIVATGENEILYLDDPESPWQRVLVDPSTTTRLDDVVWIQNRFLAMDGDRAFESTDGLNWETSEIDASPFDQRITFFEDGPEIYLFDLLKRTFISTNGGLGWTAYQDLLNGTTAGAPRENGFLLGTSSGSFFAFDDLLEAGYPETEFRASFPELTHSGGQFIMAATQVRSSPDGETWITSELNELDFPSLRINPSSLPEVGTSAGFLWHGGESLDGEIVGYFRGATPSLRQPCEFPGEPKSYLSSVVDGPLGILATKTNTLEGSQELTLSKDGGLTWQGVPYPFSPIGEVQIVGDTYMLKTSSETRASRDLVNWVTISDFRKIIFHRGEYWGWTNLGIAKSSDLLNWSEVQAHQGPVVQEQVVSFKDAVFAIDDRKLFYTYDGLNWVDLEVGFPAWELAASSEVLLLVGTSGELAIFGEAGSPVSRPEILEPGQDSLFELGSTIRVRVESDPGPEGQQPTIRLFYDGGLIGELSSPPYEFRFHANEAGTRFIHAESAFDDGGPSYAEKRIEIGPGQPVNRLPEPETNFDNSTEVIYENGLYFTPTRFSRDGLLWHPIPGAARLGVMTNPISGNGVILSETSDEAIRVTRDGVNWTGVPLPATLESRIQFDQGWFWAIATTSGSSRKAMLLSRDGFKWESRPILLPGPKFETVRGNPQGFLMGIHNSQAWRSFNAGRTWEMVEELDDTQKLVFDGTRFLLMEGRSNPRRLGQTFNGRDFIWSEPHPEFGSFVVVDGLVYAQNFRRETVAVSTGNDSYFQFEEPLPFENIFRAEDGWLYAGGSPIYRSLDGLEWEEFSTSPAAGPGTLFSTPDGLFISELNGAFWKLAWESSEWQNLLPSLIGTYEISELSAGGDALLAINHGNEIMRSEDDGLTWTTLFESTEDLGLDTLLFRDGVWLAFGKGRALLRSINGLTFTDITAASGAQEFRTLAFSPERWLANLESGAIQTSLDGLTWTEHAPAGNNPYPEVSELLFARGSWYLLAVDPTRWPDVYYELQSPDGVIWTSQAPNDRPDSRTDQLHVTDLGVFTGRTFRPHGSTSFLRVSSEQSTFVHLGDLYQIKFGFLEKFDGEEWRPERYLGNRFSWPTGPKTRGKSINGSIYLFGAHRIVKLAEEDLAISGLATPPNDYAVGDVITVEVRLENTGATTVEGRVHEVGGFLSPNLFFGDHDDVGLEKQKVTIPTLAPGQSTLVVLSLTVPDLVAPGDHHLGILFNEDGAILETSQSNNFMITPGPVVTIPGWRLTTTINGDGSMSPENIPSLIADGSRISLTATPGPGSTFLGWSGDAAGSDPWITLEMNEDKTIEANFSERSDFHVVIQGAGSVSGAEDAHLREIGETIPLTAIPAEGWLFAGWSGAVIDENPDLELLLDAPKVLTAKFVLPLESWRSRYFSPTELNDPTIFGDAADPDADGLPNWMEYLHGSDPNNKTSQHFDRIEVAGNFLTLTYKRLTGPSGNFALTLESSRDLSEWTTTNHQERSLGIVDGIETVEARIPIRANRPGFLRFHYRQ